MNKRLLAATAALALSMASLTPLAAHAASSDATAYYVSSSSTSCDDSGPGTEAEPFCTIQAAAAAATTPGDAVLVGYGPQTGTVEITASGTAADPITFGPQPEPPEQPAAMPRPKPSTKPAEIGDNELAEVTLDGASYIDMTGFTIGQGVNITHSVQVENSSNIDLTRFYASGNVVVSGDSGNVTISRFQIDSTSGAADGNGIDVDAGGTGDAITTNVVEAFGDGGSGITVDGSADADITSNTIWDYCGAGIAVGDDSNGVASGATIENNVVEDAVTDANDEDSCAAATSAGIQVGSAADEAGLTADYNDVYPADSVNTETYLWAGAAYQTAAALDTATGQGAADSNANPEVNGDGLVDNESSPAINAANSNAPGELTADFAGNARVFDPNVPETGAGVEGYDRGAYQFVELLSAGGIPGLPGSAPAGAPVTIVPPTPNDNWANPVITYTYNFGDGTPDLSTTSAASFTHTFATAGVHTVSVYVSSGFGAVSGADTVPITILTPVTFGTTLTPYSDFGLSVDPTVTVTTDWPITSEKLNYGDGTTIDVSGDNDSELVHTYAEPGTYPITFSVTDAGGDSKTITDEFTTAGNDFTPITPTRLLNTADNLGGSEKQLVDDGSLVLKVAGVDGIPADVTAVDLNLTALDAAGGGYIQANTGTGNGTSTLNYGRNQYYSNSVIAQVSPAGTVTLENFANSKTTVLNLIADATGYFSASQADRFEFVAPARLMDTRSGAGGSTGPLGAGKTDVLAVAGAGGLPATGVAAVALNLTVTGTTGSGYLVAYPDGSAEPGTSDEDWQGSTTRAANAIVPVGTDGEIDLHNGSADGGVANVLVDVTGYFTASTTGDVYVPLTPSRVLDTRRSSAIPADGSVTVNLAQLDGIPGAPTPMDYPYLDQTIDGFVFNTTATDTEQPGWLRVSDGVTSATSTSTVNWTGSGQTVANLAISQDEVVNGNPITTPGYFVSVYNGSPGDPVQALLDVMGYFAPS
jgi:PKD domain/Right handed beta helix region